MKAAAELTIEREGNKLASMMATLCSYEDQFGPNHPCTLGLMTQIGIELGQAAELERARYFLERAIRALDHYGESDSELRLRALFALKNICEVERDWDNVIVVLKELNECTARQLGCDHPKTKLLRDELEELILRQTNPCVN